METQEQPALIIIRGLPGSGKSHLARALKKSLENVVMLDPDSIDLNSEEYLAHTESLSEEGIDPKLHLYRFLRAKAYQAIEQRKTIIWNQPFSSLEIFEKMMARLNDHAAKNGTKLKVLLVEIETDPALAKKRVETRKASGGHGPSSDTFARFVKDFTSFAGAGYQVIRVSGEADIRESVAEIKARLSAA